RRTLFGHAGDGDRRPFRRSHRRLDPHPWRRPPLRGHRTGHAVMSKPIPDYPIDIFTHEAVRDARNVDDALREFAPVVRLSDGVMMLGRHEHVAAGLMDWKTFSS